MAPILFTVGPFNAYSFGIFLSLAFLFSTFIVWKFSKIELKEDEYMDAFLYSCVAALVSARLFYIIKNFNQFGYNILKYFVVRETPGLSMIGAIGGGLIFLYLYSRKKKIDFLHLADILSIAGSAALFFAKIGEQLGGAAFGKKTDLFMGIKVIGMTGRYFPVEILESLAFFLVTVFLIWYYHKAEKNKWPKGLAFYLFLELAAIIIFLVEYLKVTTVYLYNLSIRQIVTLVIIIVLIQPIIRLIRTNREKGNLK